MPNWLSPIFPIEAVAWQSDCDLPEALVRLRSATEPAQFSSVVRPAVVGVCTASRVHLWVQGPAMSIGRLNRFRPRFVGALSHSDGKAVLIGQFDLSPSGTVAMAVVLIGAVSGAVTLIAGDLPRLPVALVGVGMAWMVTSSRRQYLEDIAFVSQSLQTALQRAPNMPLQPTSGRRE